MGDLDFDGRATVVDLLRLKAHLDGSKPLPSQLIPFADVNGDGKLDSADIATLSTIILGNTTLPALKDSDNDGLPDLIELAIGSNPSKADSVGNGVKDGERDADQDGLSNAQEALLGTDPMLVDTDGDGWSDETEMSAGSDPLNTLSRPKFMFFAAPAIQATIPSSRADSRSAIKFGLIYALPQVMAVSPNSASSMAMSLGMTMASPPVTVVNPSSFASGGISYGLSLATPPVMVVSPASTRDSTIPMGTTHAQPTITAVTPSSQADKSLMSTMLAQPPVKAKISN